LIFRDNGDALLPKFDTLTTQALKLKDYARSGPNLARSLVCEFTLSRFALDFLGSKLIEHLCVRLHQAKQKFRFKHSE
jgi:hypothetical protein